MKDPKEEWARLCKQASTEQDRGRLLILVRRILRLLHGKRDSPSLSPPIQPRGSGNDGIVQIRFRAGSDFENNELTPASLASRLG